MKIAVIIPAYNESKVIAKVLNTIPAKFQDGKQRHAITVIVIDDGSSDTTSQVVQTFRRVRLIRHIVNSGAGAATRTGISYAHKLGVDLAVTMDADGQHTFADAKKVIRASKNGKVDFVIGSRLINTKGMPWYRILGNRLLNIITFLLFGVFVTDSQSGLKAFNKNALSVLDYKSNNFAFCSEMIWQAKRRGLTIREVPIRAIYTKYSLQKGQRNMDVVHILRNLLKQRVMDIING